MAGRADPLRAAADVVAAVEAAATAAGGADTVATVGALRLSPNAANSIPREVSLTVDVRDIDKRRRDAVVRAVRSAAVAAAKARRVKLSIASPNADPPAACDPDVVTAARGAAAELGMHAPDVVSRAYHDTLILAPYTRAGMVFVRCRAGVSHTPDEYASAADIEAGVKVLALTLAELARGGTPADPPPPRATSCPVTGIVASGVGSFVCPVNQLAGMVGRALGLKGVGGKGGGRAAAGGEL
jgi:acetylornithine deacetylase/succinyl-diaminopimelate desuccinylase-like protein